MAKSTRTKKPSNIEPTQKQIEARKKLGEMAKLRAKARKEAENKAIESPTSDLNTEDEYIITVNVNDKEYICETNNIVEALEELGLNILVIKTRMKLNIKKGNKQYNGIFIVPIAKKILKWKVFRNIFVNRLYFK